MKTKTLKKNKVNVVTLGCSKNIVDSEILMHQLQANNYEVEHEASDNDSEIVIINTCGFIDNAKQESIDTVLQFVQAKKKGLVDKVYVTGCLSERYKEDLSKEIPEVDAYFGTRQLPTLLKTLKADYKHELIGERLLTTPNHYAYFKIAEGCDRPCSFCAIPLMRGKHRSTPIEQLVESAKGLVANGTKELILIAQDLTYYGLDIYGKRELASLLEKLSDIDELKWIRLHYAFPAGFPMEVLDVIKERENICNYIDIPLQHINDRILKSMRRGSTKQKTNELLQAFRTKVPDMAIRTTLITGYPGETDKEFEEMLAWVKEVEFDRLGAFTYSHEQNTHAYLLEDDVPEDVKQERAAQLMNVQTEISLRKNELLVGTEQNVLFDRVEGDYFIGRTQFDSPEVDNEVMVSKKDHYLQLGDFTKVRITKAEHFDLYANPV